ncbi:SRPBCC family protein [Amycolatopsis sp. NPDC059021]|uniref:SRPBCC family protein n=1 Tax=Amycolatopsis sp. NPDC059021 TaxID=3346704 RepID=UPI00366AF0D1
MAVYNVHSRRFDVPAARVGELLSTLATAGDRLWPAGDWPPIRFDGPLAPGARGGHASVRYFVESVVPGSAVRFRFTAPRGLGGFHEFAVLPRGEDACELRHVLAGRLSGSALVTWPLFWRPMHDAVLEQLLDNAERALTGGIARPSVWSPYVRFLRSLARAAQIRSPRSSPDAKLGV